MAATIVVFVSIEVLFTSIATNSLNVFIKVY